MKDAEICEMVFALIDKRLAYEGFQLHFHILSPLKIRLGVAQTNHVLDVLQSYFLIERKDSFNADEDAFIITELGKETVTKFKTYSAFIAAIEQEKNKTGLLEQETKVLQHEKLVHERTIREQEGRIRDMTEELTALKLIKHYWWVLLLLIAIGGAIEKIFRPLAFLLRLLSL